MQDKNVPSQDCFELIKIINENNWCDIDKIIVTEKELLEFSKMEKTTFERAFAEILEVEISMIDNGEKTDAFFVHL